MIDQTKLTAAADRARAARLIRGSGGKAIVVWLEDANIDRSDFMEHSVATIDAAIEQIGPGVHDMRGLLAALWQHGFQVGWTTQALYGGLDDDEAFD